MEASLYMMVLCGGAALPCPLLIYENAPDVFVHERTYCIEKIKQEHSAHPNYVGYCVRKDGNEVINEVGEITDLATASNRWVSQRARSSSDAAKPPSHRGRSEP